MALYWTVYCPAKQFLVSFKSRDHLIVYWYDMQLFLLFHNQMLGHKGATLRIAAPTESVFVDALSISSSVSWAVTSSGAFPLQACCIPCSSSTHPAPGKKATPLIYKVLVRPSRESNFRLTSTETEALTKLTLTVSTFRNPATCTYILLYLIFCPHDHIFLLLWSIYLRRSALISCSIKQSASPVCIFLSFFWKKRPRLFSFTSQISFKTDFNLIFLTILLQKLCMRS